MSTTTTVLANVLLGLLMVGSLLVLLGYFGVHKDRHHRRRLRQWYRHRRAQGHRAPKHVAN